MPDRESPARMRAPSVQPPAGDDVRGAIQPFAFDCKHDAGLRVGDPVETEFARPVRHRVTKALHLATRHGALYLPVIRPHRCAGDRAHKKMWVTRVARRGSGAFITLF